MAAVAPGERGARIALPARWRDVDRFRCCARDWLGHFGSDRDAGQISAGEVERVRLGRYCTPRPARLAALR